MSAKRLFRGPLPELTRARRVAEVLVRNGLGHIVQTMGLSNLVPPWRSRHMGPDARAARLSFPERLRRTLEELGATYIKLGQMLSTRPDILPRDYIVELSKLLDAAPPVPGAEIVKTIEEDLGRPIADLFQDFDMTPIASASIGQVHRATLPDGSPVVVKAQRPGVQDTIEADLNILLAEARFLEGRSEALRNYRITHIVEEFADALRAEVDYTREGRNAETLRRISDPNIVIVPEVHWDLTSHKVITMERLDGILLSQTDRMKAEGYEPDQVAARLAHVYLTHVFENGVFHADPHPANILLSEGKLGLMDFGSVGYLSPTLRSQLGDLLLSLIQQDVDEMVYIIAQMGATSAQSDLPGLKSEMQRLMARYYGATLESVPISEFLSDLMTASFRYRVRLPADLALLVRTILVLEGVTRALDPSFDFTTFVEPYARQIVRARFSLKRTIQETSHTWRDVESLAHVLPRRVESITDQLDTGNLTVGFDIRNLPSTLRKLDAMANRLSFSVIVAALVVGSALVLAAGPEVSFTIPFTNIILPIPEIGFIMAGFMGAWLLFSIIRSRGL